MLLYNKRIVVTGGSGRFGQILKKKMKKVLNLTFFFLIKKNLTF